MWMMNAAGVVVDHRWTICHMVMRRRMIIIIIWGGQ